jgi:glutamate 5-kinase
MRKLPDINTLVIKIGSSIITDSNYNINEEFLRSLVKNISQIKAKINNIIIVSSGAVAAGFKVLKFDNKPTNINDKQACAAVGQTRLMWYYERAFSEYDLHTAQILITKDDFSNRRRYLNAKYTLRILLEKNIIPIINENDTVVVDELKYVETFGDNDNLSALVASLIQADMLLILSDVDGLYDKNPLTSNDAKLITDIKFINEELLESAGKSVSKVGTGGMKSKILAVKKAMDSGCYVGIINGKKPENIIKFLNGENVGTFFYHSDDPVSKRKHWIAFAAIPQGKLTIDSGAVKALIMYKKSLLATGIKKTEGNFNIGDIVIIQNENNIEIARGKVRYNCHDIQQIIGKKSTEIYKILGYYFGDEIIHRDDLVISDNI